MFGFFCVTWHSLLVAFLLHCDVQNRNNEVLFSWWDLVRLEIHRAKVEETLCLGNVVARDFVCILAVSANACVDRNKVIIVYNITSRKCEMNITNSMPTQQRYSKGLTASVYTVPTKRPAGLQKLMELSCTWTDSGCAVNKANFCRLLCWRWPLITKRIWSDTFTGAAGSPSEILQGYCEEAWCSF